MNWPAVPWGSVPTIASALLREADDQARTRFAIEPAQLMEIAGWQVARVATALLGGVDGRRITVVAGPGNNGGDALAAARFLRQRGAVVRACLVTGRDASGLAARHGRTIRALGIPVEEAPRGIDASADLMIDGLFGTGIRLPLRDPAAAVIRAMQGARVPIVSIDVPSGLDADSGAGAEAALHAAVTVALVAPKPGLAEATNAGRVLVADIGLPPALFGSARDGLAALYAIGDLVELRPSS